LLAYRISSWDTPLRVNPNRSPGRYNHAEAPATQYLGLHPLTPWAEYLRTNELFDEERLAERRLRIWVLQVDLSAALTIDFNDAPAYGLEPSDLVADDHGPCQRLAERLRLEEGAPSTIIVPSAALPGTRNAVIFGERVRIPYDWSPIDEGDVPACVIAERSQPPAGIKALVRYRDAEHEGLTAWLSGTPLGPPGFG
jgi:RES domain-containing protein